MSDIRDLETKLIQLKKNSRYVMLGVLIKSCIKPSRKTNMFYSSKTSYVQFQELLRMAIDKGLIEKKGVEYVATPKGKKYIKKLNELLSFLEG